MSRTAESSAGHARNVQGLLFIDYLQTLRRHRVGARLGRHLQLEDAHYLIAPLQEQTWYPMATLERLTLVLVDEVLGEDFEASRLWGRSQAAGLLKRYPELAAGDLRDAVMRLHTVLRGAFDYDCISLESVDDESAVLRIDFGMSPRAEATARWQFMGMFEELLCASGAVRVEGIPSTAGFTLVWSAAKSATPLPIRQRVLVVDDQKAVATALARVLSTRADVKTATTVSDAIEMLENGAFDTVLADHNLGETRDGASLLAEINQRWPQTHRVLLSGRPPTNAAELVGRGIVHGVLVKPAPSETVLRMLIDQR